MIDILLFKEDYGELWRVTPGYGGDVIWWYWTYGYDPKGSWVALCTERGLHIDHRGHTTIDGGVQCYQVQRISKLEFLLRTGRSYESTKDMIWPYWRSK